MPPKAESPSFPAFPSQPEIRGAGRCAPEAAGRHIWMLCQPKLPGGASRCATGRLRMRVVMLREFRVSDRPLSFRLGGAFCHIDRAVPPLPFRPSGSEWRNLRGAPPNRRTGGAILCPVLLVAVRQGPISACGAPREASQGHQAGADVRQFGGSGEMEGEFGGRWAIVGEIPGQAGNDGGNACVPGRE